MKTWRYSLIVLALLITSTVLGQKKEVHILAVNDMHAQLDVFPQLAALIDSLRAEDPSLLVFSAGDNRTGNPVNDKYDVHSLSRLIGLSSFRYICANIFPDDTTNIKTVPCQVFDVEGLKVGVIGAIQLSPKGIPSTHPDNISGIHFKPAEEVIPQY